MVCPMCIPHMCISCPHVSMSPCGQIRAALHARLQQVRCRSTHGHVIVLGVRAHARQSQSTSLHAYPCQPHVASLTRTALHSDSALFREVDAPASRLGVGRTATSHEKGARSILQASAAFISVTVKGASCTAYPEDDGHEDHEEDAADEHALLAHHPPHVTSGRPCGAVKGCCL